MQTEWMYLLIFVVILGAFGTGITAMLLKAKARERIHKERMLLAEKGMEIPKELYAAEFVKRRGSTVTALRVIGTVFAVAGIAPMAAIAVAQGFPNVVYGAGLTLIGVGLLIAARVVARSESSKGD